MCLRRYTEGLTRAADRTRDPVSVLCVIIIGMQRTSTPRFDRPEDTRSGQLSLDDVGTDLSQVSFVVVDLETTGTSNGLNDITEIGAVRTRGGELLGEFSTLVKPEGSVISPFVERLTGITNGMVVDAPPLASVLPAFLEFAHGSVLVAHNAGFDIGFLQSACAKLDYPWPAPIVLDTVKLARQAVPRPEVRNHKLSTLAAHFGTDIEPNHRALADARATSEILHRLFERFGSVGVTTLEELRALKPAGWKRRNSKAHLAADVPHGPGVYMFVDGSRRVLYVGQSGDMRTRVRNYFGVGETRGRMAEMVTAAQSVTTVPCETALEAQVREVRLIAELAPPYNRRSKHPDRAAWVTLTREPFPRLSVARRRPAPGTIAAGPFTSYRRAVTAKDVLEDLFPVRRCTQRPGSSAFAPCAAAQMGRCGGPCVGQDDPHIYGESIAGLRNFLAGDPAGLLARFRERIAGLAQTQRYERAAEVRDALTSALSASARGEQSQSLSSIAQIAAAAPRPEGGWDLALVRHGRLAGTAVSLPGANPYPVLDALELTAEHVPEDSQTLGEEQSLILRWLSDGATRLVRTSAPLMSPVRGAAQALSGLRAPRPAAGGTQ